MFKKMPFLLLGLILVCVILTPYLSLKEQSFLYALSLSIKSLILFLLPFVIFSLLFKVTVELARKATHVIVLILVAVSASNFLSTWLSHSIGSFVYQFDLSIVNPKNIAELTPLWIFELPSWLPNDKAMGLAIILGCIASFFKPTFAHKMANKLGRTVDQLLRSFTYIVPIFIVGFIIKLSHDGAITLIIRDYSKVFTAIGLSVFGYIALVYLLVNRFNIKKGLHCLRNMLPAGIAGFSTMSSAAAMPFTLMGTEKNANNKELASSVIPATVNIHLIGDCFAIPILAFAILKSFGLPPPALTDYFVFASFFVIAKFSVAAVPGGGIIVMLPILENYLGFTSPMLSLITALYILFDPIITSANVLGNGGFALMIDKLHQHKEKLRHPV